MKLSIVILNWNGSRMMRQYLPSVLRHSLCVEGVEVVVADNASTDDSLPLLRRDFPEVRLILLDRNYGFAEGYNRALQEVGSEYALLLNSDVEPAAGWLPPLLHFMDTHPQVAACQPKVRSLKERTRFEFAGACGGWIDAYGYPFCRGRVMDVVEEDRGQYDTSAEIFWATGAALLVRTANLSSKGHEAQHFDFRPQEEAAVQPQTPAMAMGGLAGKRLDQLLNAMRQQQIDLPVKMVITQHNERWPFGTLIEEVGREHQLFVAMERLQRLCKRAQRVEGFDPILIKRAQDALSRMRSEQEATTREELEGLSDQLESLLG